MIAAVLYVILNTSLTADATLSCNTLQCLSKGGCYDLGLSPKFGLTGVETRLTTSLYEEEAESEAEAQQKPKYY